MADFNAVFLDNDTATFNAEFLDNDTATFNAEFGNTVVIETGDKFFEYIQLAPAAVWEISHPLKKFPSVTVVDSGGSVVVGDIEYIDDSNISLIFKSSFSGKAYLN